MCVYCVIITSQLSPAVCTVCLDYKKTYVLLSWLKSWPVFYLIKQRHVSQNLWKTLWGCLRAFLYSLYRIFSSSAVIGPSLTSSVYFRMPRNQIGNERHKKWAIRLGAGRDLVSGLRIQTGFYPFLLSLRL